MRAILLVALAVLGVLVVTGFGSSSRATCPVTRAHSVANPLFGATLALGGPRVELNLTGNRGDLRRGRVTLGRTGFPGWFGLKTHFMTPPSFRGGFTVRVRRLHGAGAVGLGGGPPGGSFTAAGGPAPNEARGWRDFPVPATWLRAAGCVEYEVRGRGFGERIVVDARRP